MKKKVQGARRVVFPILFRGQSLLETADNFCWIENQSKNFLKLFGWDPVFQQVLDQRPQGSRGVINDVAEFFVFAVNIADHMDRSARQGEFRGKTCNLGDRPIDVRYL